MYDELDEDGKRRYTVAQIAAEFGVARPMIYRHLSAAGATMCPSALGAACAEAWGEP
jgi:DNA-binding phage protein